MFALVACAAVLWRGNHQTASPLPIVVAALLKLFPAAGLGAYLLARHSAAALTATVGAVATAVYALVTLDDLRAISDALPQVRMHSYGSRIIVSGIVGRIGSGFAAALPSVEFIALLAVAVLALAAWWISQRYLSKSSSRPLGPVEWRLHALHLGALIYLATFALLNSWDYRLVFLLLTLPQLLEWSTDATAPERPWARGTLVTVLLCLYLGPLLADRSVLDEVVGWVLAGLLSILVAGSLVNVRFWRWRA